MMYLPKFSIQAEGRDEGICVFQPKFLFQIFPASMLFTMSTVAIGSSSGGYGSIVLLAVDNPWVLVRCDSNVLIKYSNGTLSGFLH